MTRRLMAYVPVAVLTMVLLLLVGCATTVCTQADMQPQTMVYQEPGGRWESRLTTDRRCYEEGQMMHVTFEMTNTADELLVFGTSEVPGLDIALPSPQPEPGHPNWLWSDSNPVPSELKPLLLQPGETYTVTWDVIPIHVPGGFSVWGVWRAPSEGNIRLRVKMPGGGF